MLDEKDGKNMVVINEAAVKTFGMDTNQLEEN